MPTYEVYFSAYNTIVADSEEDARDAFSDYINQEFPEFELNSIIAITEEK